jgi:plastocyanin
MKTIESNSASITVIEAADMQTKIMAILIMGFLLVDARAATFRVKVVDNDGDPIAQAAVYVQSQSPALTKPAKPKSVIIDQMDKEFVNHFTIIRTGTPVIFPNHDNIRHHVYSFSEAKNFELPLYVGTPAKPVIFDKAGVVNLGCNIHDWMSAYILVVDSPFFALTDKQGIAELNLPDGPTYVLTAWHPQLKSLVPEFLNIAANADHVSELALSMRLKRNARAIRLPTELGLNIGYR